MRLILIAAVPSPGESKTRPVKGAVQLAATGQTCGKGRGSSRRRCRARGRYGCLLVGFANFI